MDGALPHDENIRIGEHVRTCNQCQSVVRMLQGIRNTVQHLPRETWSDETALRISSRVQQQVREEEEWRIIERTAERLLAGLAIIVVLLLGASSLMSRAQNGNEVQTAGILDEFISDTTVTRLVNAETLSRDEVLAAAIFQE